MTKTKLIIFGLLGTVFIIGLVFFLKSLISIHNDINSSPENIFGWAYSNLGNDKFRKSKDWFEKYAVYDIESYGLNKPSTKEAMIIDFSRNDLFYNDSIIGLSLPKGFINDKLKSWRSAELIHKKKKYKIKYRLHGSDISNYKEGYISLKIKAKKHIDGKKRFSLISSFIEGTVVNVFLSTIAQQQNLIGPDPGKIVLANTNKKIEDYWFTEDLSNDYLKSKYNLNKFHIYENSDNWSRSGGPHFSELDGFYYYLDEDNSLNLTENTSSNQSTYKYYKSFVESIRSDDEKLFSFVDKKYIGRFLANLYFFYHPHHIQGDNNKWLHDFKTDIFFPIARNEGMFSKASNFMKFDNDIFNRVQNQSKTFDFYKRAICNDTIKFYRDQELQKLISNKDSILTTLDDLYSEYYDLHRYFNVSFIGIRFRYKDLKSTIKYNTSIISKYLQNGEVIFAFDLSKNELKVATDIRVPIKIEIPNLAFSKIINGIDLNLEKGKITSNLIENAFLLKEKVTKQDIIITNMVSGDRIDENNIIFNYF